MATEKWVADAHQLLIEIERIYEDHYSRSYNQCVHDIFNAMRRIVRRNATFRTVEVVHGRWIEKIDMLASYLAECEEFYCECSVCNTPNFGESPYCPNCGAKMDGDGNV
jgi:hypothetical protein